MGVMVFLWKAETVGQKRRGIKEKITVVGLQHTRAEAEYKLTKKKKF
jgi:hypothetical protein